MAGAGQLTRNGGCARPGPAAAQDARRDSSLPFPKSKFRSARAGDGSAPVRPMSVRRSNPMFAASPLPAAVPDAAQPAAGSGGQAFFGGGPEADAEAEAALAAIDSADADQTAKATVYVKAMRKLVAAGAAYVDEEVGRINK